MTAVGRPARLDGANVSCLVALNQDRQTIEPAFAVAVRSDDDALHRGWNETQIQAQCMFCERDAAARVTRSVVEDEIGVSVDLAPLVQQQGDEVYLCFPRPLQMHIHGGGGDGDVLAGCQVHAFCHCPSTMLGTCGHLAGCDR